MKNLKVFLVFCFTLFFLINMFNVNLLGTVKKVYVTQAVNPHPPVIDGKINDPVWHKVDWEGNFVQRIPYEGKKPSQDTKFKILYDDKNLYVIIKAYDTEPDRIVKRMARRDNSDGDWVGIEIDSYHDLRTAFSFRVNAAGVKTDYAVTENGDNRDEDWDPIWFVKTNINGSGWTAEMRIPLSQLRFSNRDNQVWGVQVTRQLFRKEEQSTWQFIPRNESGWVHAFGELRGIKSIKPKRRMAIIPYSVGTAERFEQEEGNPFSTGKAHGLTGGIDGKIGLTSDLTLDFTINPDFGQVEADPSEVNLTAFETYFDEKRPFFTEGRNILNFDIMGGDGTFSQDNLFYSRRIGRSPQHYPDTEDDEYVDMPVNTSILGAMKVTGKTRNGLSVGIMNSVTAREHARIDFQGRQRTEQVEPLTNYFTMRLQQDYRGGDTLFGGMFTATNRSLNDPGLNFLHKAAYTGGLDFSHRWKDKTYYLSVKTLFSHVRGSKEAISETQESPVHNFQRPDATHLTFDPNRTSLTGWGGTVNIGKSGKGRLRFSGGATWRSPGLELNDIGYLYTSDVIMQWSWIGYRINKPFSIFKRISLNFNQWQGWDFDGAAIFSGGNVNGYMQFKNNWGMGFGVNRQGNALSTSVLRGGPALKRPGGWGFWWNTHSDGRKSIRANVGTSQHWGDSNYRRSQNYWLSVTYKPSNSLSLSLSPSLNISTNVLQYVETMEMDKPDDNRYIMAAIDRKTVAFTVRLNYSITPELSIQFYGQPYVSAGKYSDFNRIIDPLANGLRDRYHIFATEALTYNGDDELYAVDENGDGIDDYSFDNPNFNFLQFRSNLVVRWEYYPGSTVYLVWSQGKTDTDTTGDFSFSRGMRDLFKVRAHNVFLVKFTYRFNL